MDFHISGELKRYNHLITETDRAYHEASLRLGLSDSAMIILYTICEDGQERCPLKELCRRSGLSKQAVNSALRKLEGEEILSLEKAGGKNKNVRLTEKGKALADNTALRIMEAENEIFASWPREEVEKYLQLMEQYLISFREKAAKICEEDESYDTFI